MPPKRTISLWPPDSAYPKKTEERITRASNKRRTDEETEAASEPTKRRRVNVVGTPTEVSDVNAPEQKKHGRKKPLKHSNFHVIINTNVRANAGSELLEKVIKRTKEATDKWLSTENMGDYLNFRDGVGQWNNSFIEKARHEQVIERGEANDQVHVHIMLSIDHRTNLQVNSVKLQNYYSEELDEWIDDDKSAYCHVVFHKHIPDFRETVSNYIRKNIRKDS
jgi:hypothetical protein